ncbi:MAG: hypothetical protein AB8B78_05070 [Polaribacter sp.]
MLKNTKIRAHNFIQLILFVMVVISCNSNKSTEKTNYYFNPILGSNQNSGTSKNAPFKTLTKIKELHLKAGDSILLKANTVFKNTLVLENIKGSEKEPIIISNYADFKNASKTIINTTGALNGILVENSSFIEINNIKVTANPSTEKKKNNKKEMRCGVLIKTSKKGNYQHIYLKNIDVSDVFYENENFSRSLKETKSANGTQNYGWGIRFINNTKNALLSDLKVDGCVVKNVSHTGIKFTSRIKNYGIKDFIISNTKVKNTGGPGIQMSGVINGHIFNNVVDKSGSANDSRKWGRGSGLWTWGSANVLIENNRFTNANGPGDSAGAHIDFNCNNIVLQYNFSANNAGGFCEILGNNYNCAYRYNISVNDGFRVKGENNAFQEGKIFWLSGYIGKGKRKGPFNSYFYNNTIYVKEVIQSKMALAKEAKGILIANNIFHIEGESKMVKGDQYNPEKNGKWSAKNIFFENNLYLHKSSWPEKMPIQDDKSLYGNADFINPGGFSITDYISKNKDLIKNKGIVIPKIKNDSIGVFYGLHPTKDILGNNITKLPDLGAIELKIE